MLFVKENQGGCMTFLNKNGALLFNLNTFTSLKVISL
jgi:hypothetical protein